MSESTTPNTSSAPFIRVTADPFGQLTTFTIPGMESSNLFRYSDCSLQGKEIGEQYYSAPIYRAVSLTGDLAAVVTREQKLIVEQLDAERQKVLRSFVVVLTDAEAAQWANGPFRSAWTPDDVSWTYRTYGEEGNVQSPVNVTINPALTYDEELCKKGITFNSFLTWSLTISDPTSDGPGTTFILPATPTPRPVIQLHNPSYDRNTSGGCAWLSGEGESAIITTAEALDRTQFTGLDHEAIKAFQSVGVFRGIMQSIAKTC